MTRGAIVLVALVLAMAYVAGTAAVHILQVWMSANGIGG